ncbi:MAG: TOBE domain-containing protein [Campylobacterota bacterium]|nr:TOBE domain-containing protein [Campylobacterota bacterium]
MNISSNLTLELFDQPFLLEKRIELLKAIESEGSISKAAKKVPMSYKSAWDAVDSMNNLSHTPIVSKETGGKGGGGTSLTSYGKNLLDTYKALQEEQKIFLQRLGNMTDIDTGTFKTIQRLSMQISARNQLNGTIEHIELGSVNVQVHLKLKSGFVLVSVITKGAVESLDLKVGDDVVAIFKSNSVLLSKNSDLKISAQNQLNGTIETINEGGVNSEVIIDLGNSEKIASIITVNSTQYLELKEGDSVTAIIKSSDLMVGK